MTSQAACILGCAGTRLAPEEAAFFKQVNPWGFILFARNIETPDQLSALTADLRACLGHDAPILIDQEGGRVQRMRAPHWREWLPPLDQMERLSPAGAIRAMELRYQIIGAELRAVGIDTNCAPMADIARSETHPFLRNRCYGSDLSTVVVAASAVARGLIAGGVLPVLKHIPGHGLGRLDSHLELPIADVEEGVLYAQDFAAFKGLNHLPMGMTAHLIYPAIDSENPATQSSKVLDVVRTKLGFEGLLMTDDISMEALSGSVTDRSLKALQAGCDLILHCNGDLAEMRVLAEALPSLTKGAQARADQALAQRPAPQSLDLAALDAEFDAILQEPA